MPSRSKIAETSLRMVVNGREKGENSSHIGWFWLRDPINRPTEGGRGTRLKSLTWETKRLKPSTDLLERNESKRKSLEGHGALSLRLFARGQILARRGDRQISGKEAISRARA